MFSKIWQFIRSLFSSGKKGRKKDSDVPSDRYPMF